MHLGLGVTAATAGARPTGITSVDAFLLGLAGAGISACSVRTRTLPLYVFAAVALVLQGDPLSRVVAAVALALAFLRRWKRRSAILGALAGGLAFAGAVGVSGASGAAPLWLALAPTLWVLQSAHQTGSREFRRRLDHLVLGMVGAVLIFGGLGMVAALEARSSLERGADLLRDGLSAARAGDTEEAEDLLRSAQRLLDRASTSLGAPWARPSWLVPGVSQNMRTLYRLVGAVDDLAEQAASSAGITDLDSLHARHGRFDLAAIGAVEGPLRDLVETLQEAEGVVRELDDQWLAPPVQEALKEVQAELADALPYADLAVRAVTIAPQLLGEDEPTTYLALFTTPVEARATLGFPGNFAEITFDDGAFEMTRFGRIRDLNYALPPDGAVLEGVNEYLARYGQHRPDLEWRNITMSPDLPTVAEVVRALYPQSGGRPIDGVLVIDPTALAALLQFTGPVVVPGMSEPLTSENAADYLLRDQYLDYDETPERIDALEDLAEVTFRRLSEGDLPGIGGLREALGPAVEQKHLQLWIFDSDAAPILDQLGLSGRYPPVEGDFIGVTTTNAAGNKIDLFLERHLSYEVRWDPSTGRLEATATVTLTNNAPASGLPPYVIGNVRDERPGEQPMPDGWNHTFVTLYTPWEDEGTSLDGEPVGVAVHDELGRRALSTYVSLAPGQTSTLTFKLSGTLSTSKYLLDLAAQPMVRAERASVRIRVAGGPRVATSGPVAVSGGWAEGEFPLTRDERIVVDRP